MRITNSVSFWIIVISVIIGCLIGSVTHWVIGMIIFFLIAGKSAIIGIILDTISGGLEYHHDRQDMRVKKTIASLMLARSAQNGVRPSPDMRLKNLK